MKSLYANPVPETKIPQDYLEEKRYHGCTRKEAFTDKSKATKAINSIRRYQKLKSGVLAAYLCLYCKQWHLGHNAKFRVKAKRRKSNFLERDDDDDSGNSY